MKVKVGVSNHHIHLKEEDLKKLFGEEHILEKDFDLNQPNQYASLDYLTIKTDKSEINKVRVLGPVRPYTQIEISKTDAYKLGINPPIRDSGDLLDSETVTLVGPKGSIITDGCILAHRHIHLNKAMKDEYHLDDVVSVKIDGIRGGVLDNVRCKMIDEAYFELHLDCDEANALGLKTGDEVEII